jgi:hypothetical protein
VLVFVGCGASIPRTETIFFLGEGNLQRYVDFLFGRTSGEAYSATHPPPSTTPETNHEHDVETAGPTKGVPCKQFIVRSCNFMSCVDWFAHSRDPPRPPSQYFPIFQILFALFNVTCLFLWATRNFRSYSFSVCT